MLFKRLDAEDGENVMFSMEKIGANIMKCRKAVGMTQMELADKMGISFQAVSNWERGLSCPDIAKLTELSNVFDVSIDEILGNNRAVEIVTDIENDDIPDLELNEIKDVAPILKQKQMDEIVEKVGHLDLDDIVSVAPFLSQEFIDNVTKKTYEEKGISGIVKIAPFVSDDLLNTFAMQTLKKDGFSALMPVLPFIDSKMIDDFAYVAYDEKGISGIVSVAPFMSDNLLNTFAIQTLEKEGVSAIAPILPFIDSKIVEDYIVNKKR